MRGESYTLQEVAELLGVSKRTLQRRIREGAFPGRFLSPGPHGLETRIPADDVRRALDDTRPDVEHENRSMLVRHEPRPASSALTTSDLEAVRDAVIAITRSDRDALLEAVRDAITSRDREIAAMRAQLGSLQGSVERLRHRIEAWTEAPAPAPPSSTRDSRRPSVATPDLGAALLDDIEEMLSQLSGPRN